MADGGVYRGNRVDGADYFDDVMGDNEVPEIFRGSGMEKMEKVVPEPTPAGMYLNMQCRPPGCGAEKKIFVPWPELFVVANAPKTGVLPPDWKRSEINQAPVPDLACSRCGTAVSPVIPPDWAARQVDAALQRGWLTVEQLNADPLVQQVRAAVAGAHPQMR